MSLECIQLGHDRGSSQLALQCCKQPLHVVLFKAKLMCRRRGEDLKEDPAYAGRPPVTYKFIALLSKTLTHGLVRRGSAPRFNTRPLRLGPRACGLACKPFTNHVRLHLPRHRRGHEGVHDAVQPAWNDSGAVFEQTAEALRYALLDAHWFHRHGLRIEGELFEPRCVRKPGRQYSDVDT